MNLQRVWGSLALSNYFSDLYGAKRNKSVIQFRHVCNAVQQAVMQEITSEHEDSDYGTEAQMGALLGKPDSVRYFSSKIARYLKEHNISNVEFPSCYRTLIEAVYHEVWGYSVLAEWFSLPDCQSAKVIGDNVYYLRSGRMMRQPHTIPHARREQLKNNLLLNTPEKMRNADHVEMNLVTGERITIFDNKFTKPGYDVIVLRKYIVKNFTWEEQARLGTIHSESVKLMKSFCQVGFNVIFTGAVRSGKTTMLETWQSYEDPALEGCAIEMTDEIKFDRLLPGSPIMQLLVKEDNIDGISMPVLRSDADYLILAEARRGEEFDLMVRLANKGTNRCKTTLHTTDVSELIYAIADEILAVRPNAQYDATLMKVAKAYHYVIQLAQLYHDKSSKRVIGIYEICADRTKGIIEMYQICRYDYQKDKWQWAFHIGNDKYGIALRENAAAFEGFKNELKSLASQYGMEGDIRSQIFGGEQS